MDSATNVKSDMGELVSLRELARHTKMPLSWFYERSRFDSIPGQCRLGHHVRVNLSEFMAALRAGKVR